MVSLHGPSLQACQDELTSRVSTCRRPLTRSSGVAIVVPGCTRLACARTSMCCSDCLALSMIRPLGVLIMTGLRCLSEASWYAGGVWSLRGCLFCKKSGSGRVEEGRAWDWLRLRLRCGYIAT